MTEPLEMHKIVPMLLLGPHKVSTSCNCHGGKRLADAEKRICCSKKLSILIFSNYMVCHKAKQY